MYVPSISLTRMKQRESMEPVQLRLLLLHALVGAACV
jgi:hypothetical protein